MFVGEMNEGRKEGMAEELIHLEPWRKREPHEVRFPGHLPTGLVPAGPWLCEDATLRGLAGHWGRGLEGSWGFR